MGDSSIEQTSTMEGKVLVEGRAQGPVLATTIPLSFWGGVSPVDGEIIDRHHPLSGQSVAGKVVVVPSSRGSCTGSAVMLELLLAGHGPSALVFEREEFIVPLGVMLASEVFSISIPVVQVSSTDFRAISTSAWLRIDGNRVQCLAKPSNEPERVEARNGVAYKHEEELDRSWVKLTPLDHEFLDGSHGRAIQVAARIVLRMAILQGATELIDITQAHLDATSYTGPACVRFALQMNEWGAKFRIPSTLNSTAIDRQRWQAQGMDPAIALPAGELADAYVRMGAKPNYTCAPYLLDTAPIKGEQVIWAESNAAIFANSVLGARTVKCPDYLDVCVALTGRAPNAGCHIAANRRAQIKIAVPKLSGWDDALFPVLGYLIGDLAANRIPIIVGLEDASVSIDHLKAFGAAFATTSSAPMYHMAGVTPEATKGSDLEMQLLANESIELTQADLVKTWRQLNNGTNIQIDMVSLGNPHFSYDEFAALAGLCKGRKKSSEVAMIVTCGREIYGKAYKDGHIPTLEDFGIQIVSDTCWCTIVSPLIPIKAKTTMTNSGKYAHYGTGLTGRQMRFGSLVQCLDAACTGQASHDLPVWLKGNQ